MSSRPPYPAPSRTTRSAADCRPRLSPPASSPAVSAASSRRASGASSSEVSQAACMASTTSSPVRTLPWIAYPSPVTEPAQSRQLVPGVRGGAAVAVDDADLAVVAAGVVLEQPLQGHRRRSRRRRGGRAPGPCRRRWRRPGWRWRRPGPRRRVRRSRPRGTWRRRPLPTTRRRRIGPRSRRSCADSYATSFDREPRPDDAGWCGCSRDSASPSVGPHRRFVTAIAVDAVGSGVFMPVSMLYFLAVTPLTLVQVGAWPSRSRRWSPCPPARVIGALVDRIGAKRVLLVGNVLQAVGFVAYLVAESFAAVLLWTIVVTVGRTAFWGSYGNIVAAISRPGERERWFGFLGALRNVGFAVGGLASGVAITIGTDLAFERRRRGQRGVVRCRLLAAAGGPRAAARGTHARPAGLVGDGAARPALPPARGRPGRLLAADDDPELRAAGVRRHRAGPARLGHRRGVHHQLPDGRASARGWSSTR